MLHPILLNNRYSFNRGGHDSAEYDYDRPRNCSIALAKLATTRAPPVETLPFAHLVPLRCLDKRWQACPQTELYTTSLAVGPVSYTHLTLPTIYSV